MTIYESSEHEREVCRKIRVRCIEVINLMSLEAAGELLGLAPEGVESCMRWHSWPLEDAFRIARCLGLNPNLKIG